MVSLSLNPLPPFRPSPQSAQVPALNYPLCDKDEGEEEPPGLS